MSDTKALSLVLDEFNIEYNIISDTKADLYSAVNVSQLVLRLTERNCTVLSMCERDESLEGYYINLVGGNNND